MATRCFWELEGIGSSRDSEQGLADRLQANVCIKIS